MPTITFTVDTRIPPETLVQALTDFSPDRPKRWRNIDPDYYKVHGLGENWAEVTEGSGFAGGVWERTRYDWSQPGLVTATVQESNSFAPGSFWKYQIAPDGKGGSRVTCTVLRIGKGAKGRVVAMLAGLFGKRVLRKDFELMVAQIATPPG
jgi:hypothetical protein